MTARSKAGAALALLALAALATAPAASPQTQLRPATKARAGQEASRGAPIPYYNAAPRSAEFVHRAVRAWNRALVGTHFVAASRRDARVVIRPAPPRAGCDGLARIRGSRASKTRDTPIRYGYGRSAVVTLGENCALPVVRAFVAAHELGHVLGLNHERRRCSVMSPRAEFVNATLKPFPSCSPRAWAALQRDLVADADRRAARAVYGGYPTDGVAPRASDEPSLGLFGWAAIGLLAVLALAVLTQLRRR